MIAGVDTAELEAIPCVTHGSKVSSLIEPLCKYDCDVQPEGGTVDRYTPL